jgi:hypothetical protein
MLCWRRKALPAIFPGADAGPMPIYGYRFGKV